MPLLGMAGSIQPTAQFDAEERASQAAKRSCCYSDRAPLASGERSAPPRAMGAAGHSPFVGGPPRSSIARLPPPTRPFRLTIPPSVRRRAFDAQRGQRRFCRDTALRGAERAQSLCSAAAAALRTLSQLTGLLLLLSVLLLTGCLSLVSLGQLVWIGPLALLATAFSARAAPAEPPPAPLRLRGKHVVIVGGSKDASRLVALECVRRGADVTLLAPDCEELRSALHGLKEACTTRPDGSEQHVRYSCAARRR